MDFKTKLATSVQQNASLLCVGLDSDTAKLPAHLRDHDEPMFEFNRAIIDATADLVCAFKPNSAFYEAEGPDGLSQLQKTCRYIRERYPAIPIILDAKRADIGSTNLGYTKYAFDYLGVDAITIQPYLGSEAIQPFLDRSDKGIIILCRTSNPGAAELQDLLVAEQKLYQHVAKLVRDRWNTNGNCLLVVGATYPTEMKEIRQIVGDDISFLVPGVGSQGGDIEATVRAGVTAAGDGLIINSARGIIFASGKEDFAEVARGQAVALKDTINSYRQENPCLAPKTSS